MSDSCVDCIDINLIDSFQDSSIIYDGIDVMLDTSENTSSLSENSLSVDINNDSIIVNFNENININVLKNFSYEIVNFLLYVHYGMQMVVFDTLYIENNGINLDGTIILEK